MGNLFEVLNNWQVGQDYYKSKSIIMSLKEFKVCKKCDFEWHVKDGSRCPICELSEESAEEKGGVFGTGKDADRWRDWFKLLGLVALVYIIFHTISGR